MKRCKPCNEWENLLALRLEDLSPDDRASLEAHLVTCLACANIHEHYQRIQASLAAFPIPTIEAIPYAWKHASKSEGMEELQDECSQDILERYYDNIQTLVKQFIANTPLSARLEVGKVDDLVQETCMRLYHRLEQASRSITNLQAYIQATVQHVCRDWSRKKRSVLAPDKDTDELAISQNPMINREQQELQNFIDEVIEQVIALPSCQRRAVLCLLKEHLDDTSLLAQALLEHNINLGNIDWPEDEWEKQRLCASLSIAQKKLRTMFFQQVERKGQLERAIPRSVSQIEVLFGIAQRGATSVGTLSSD